MKNIYLVKDLSHLSGQSTYTIKYYLKIGLLREIGRGPATNFRYFDDTSLEALKRIRNLRCENKSLREIKEAIGV